MPIIKVVTDQDIGTSLKVENNKLEVALDSIVDGTTVRVEGNKLTATQTVDVKLTGAELVNDTDLKLTLSDESELTVSLAKFLNVDTDTTITGVTANGNVITVASSDGTNKTVDLTAMLDAHKNASKLNELQSLAGTSLGHTIS